jgi:fructose-bisphosphate aldolase class II
MTLVKTRDLLDRAVHAHIGIAAFSVITLEYAEAIAARAQAAAAPAILHAMAPNLGRGAGEALLDADTLVVALSQARHIEGGLAHAAQRLAGSCGGPAC